MSPPILKMSQGDSVLLVDDPFAMLAFIPIPLSIVNGVSSVKYVEASS